MGNINSLFETRSVLERNVKRSVTSCAQSLLTHGDYFETQNSQNE